MEHAEYRLVHYHGTQFMMLEREVNALIKDGWIVHGSPVVLGEQLLQPMMKFAPVKEAAVITMRVGGMPNE